MPSPFPGMDPYLERSGEWKSFHNQLVMQIARSLSGRLPPGYRAKNEEMLYAHEPSADKRRLVGEADDAVFLSAGGGGPGDHGNGSLAGSTAAITCDKPSKLVAYDTQIEVRKHRYVEVRTIGDNRIVSVIELLSPTNKIADADRQAYLAKREELVSDGVHFLQIDLLRAGRHLLPESPPSRGQHNAMLVRSWQGEAELWFWSARDRLPVLPVPLLKDDADVPLDLRGAMDVVYDALRYGEFLYELPPEPPLDAETAAWADGVLRSAGIEPPTA